MTRYEKASVYVSIFAVVISLTSPVLMYYWLDPTLKQFSLRGRLEVLLIPENDELYKKIITAILMDKPPIPANPLNVEIQNIGKLPASGIQIVAQYFNEGKEGGVAFEPPVQYEASYHGTQTFITLKRSLAPQDKLKITFTDSPQRVVVSNEFGESSIVDNFFELIRHSMEVSKENSRELEKERKRLEKEIANEKQRKH